MVVDSNDMYKFISIVKKNKLNTSPVEWIFPPAIIYFASIENIKKTPPGSKILDVGCSTGYGTYLMASLLKEYTFIGVDVNKEKIESGKKVYKLNNLVFEYLDVTNEEDIVNFIKKNGCFDNVTCFEVLEHIPMEKSKKIMNNLHRIMKKDGLLFISTPNKPVYDTNHYTYDHINELEFKEFLKLTNMSGYDTLTVHGIEYINPILVKILRNFGLSARNENKKGAVSPFKKMIKIILTALFFRTCLTYFMLLANKLNHNWGRKMLYSSLKLNKDPRNSSWVFLTSCKK